MVGGYKTTNVLAEQARMEVITKDQTHNLIIQQFLEKDYLQGFLKGILSSNSLNYSLLSV